MFQTASFDEIKSMKITDVYFEKTMKILMAKGIDKRVKAEFIAKELPDNAEWGVFTHPHLPGLRCGNKSGQMQDGGW